ncbi:MAG: molecular chaperone TorD family protein [Collinsella sp.]
MWGPARPLAAPWESYYLDENNRLFTDSTREVRAAFRAHGLEFEKKNREPDDPYRSHAQLPGGACRPRGGGG